MNILYHLMTHFPETFLVFSVTYVLVHTLYIDTYYKKFNLHTIHTGVTVVFIIIITIYLVNSCELDCFIWRTTDERNAFVTFMRHIYVGCIMVCFLIIGHFASLNKMGGWECAILAAFLLLGLFILASSKNFLMVYFGSEVMTLVLFIKSVFINKDNQTSEAGLKYFILGSFSSGLLLFGCSLVYGFTGTINFHDLQLLFIDKNVPVDVFGGVFLGCIFITIGLLFKLGASPFHMWIPDVYEGVPTPITALFAIVPKIAYLTLLVRLSLVLFSNTFFFWNQIIIFSAILSIIVGTFGALYQVKIKRMLAYSAISHVGFMLIGLSSLTPYSIFATLFYLVVYLVISLNIFTLLLSLKKIDTNTEFKKINEFILLFKSNKYLAVNFCLILFSIGGIPPLVGFYSKYYVFISAIKSEIYLVAIIAAICSVIASMYYIRLIKLMLFKKSDYWTFLAEVPKTHSLIISLTLAFNVFFFCYPEIFVIYIYNIVLTLFF